MKCISRISYRLLAVILAITFILSGCSASRIDIPYDPDSDNSSFNVSSGSTDSITAKTFASDICVVDNDFNLMKLSIDSSEAGALFDVTEKETLYAKNVHKRMNPASITKIMTAYLALKYGHLEDTLTASANVYINESGAQVIGLKEGDRMTLDQALHVLMIYSANDAAIMIAEYLSGSVEAFAELMNKEALMLGATNTHFTNPHGLTDENHYTSAYDLYLIFNKVMQYEEFRKIINKNEYKTNYKDREGNEKTVDISTTNSYLKGDYSTPANVSVIGGKTGTTNAAGSCLILLSNGDNDHTYVSVILHSTDHSTLYTDMTTLLTDIH